MNQIRRLCERAFWIDGGQIHRSGPANQIVGAYEANASSECYSVSEEWESSSQSAVHSLGN